MERSNHYEIAFKAYLHGHGHCYVAVDESQRAVFDDEPLKSLDFVVYGPGDSRLVVDIKGRRFPTGAPGRERKVWECWTTEDDIAGLGRWVERFGPGYRGLLVFAYQVAPEVPLFADTEDLWTWRERRYLFRAVDVEDYRQHMRVRSPKWRTVTLPRASFREIVHPFRHFLDGKLAETPAFI